MTKPCPISFWFVTLYYHFSLKQYFLWGRWDGKMWNSEKQICSVLSCTCQTTGDRRMRCPQDIWCMIISVLLVSTQFMNQSPLLRCMFILCHLSQELVPNIRKLNFWVQSSSCWCVSGGELLRECEWILEKQCFCRVIWCSDNNVKWKAEREIMAETVLAMGDCLSVQRAQCCRWSQYLRRAEISGNQERRVGVGEGGTGREEWSDSEKILHLGIVVLWECKQEIPATNNFEVSISV